MEQHLTNEDVINILISKYSLYHFESAGNVVYMFSEYIVCGVVCTYINILKQKHIDKMRDEIENGSFPCPFPCKGYHLLLTMNRVLELIKLGFSDSDYLKDMENAPDAWRFRTRVLPKADAH